MGLISSSDLSIRDTTSAARGESAAMLIFHFLS